MPETAGRTVAVPRRRTRWLLLPAGLLALSACAAGAGENAGVEDAYRAVRHRMVRDRIEARGLRNESVLEAMRRTPRHLFVPESLRSRAYEDRPLPIGEDQTISQPYVVAFMSALADIEPGDRVLEIGTGSGYQAAVLAELGAEVWSIELLPGLAARAEEALRGAGYDEIRLRVGNGYLGWPEEAPFDRIIVTAAPPEIPPALLEQLGEDGRLVAPVGEASRIQELVLAYRDDDGEIVIEEHGAVAFVPMVDPRNR